MIDGILFSRPLKGTDSESCTGKHRMFPILLEPMILIMKTSRRQKRAQWSMRAFISTWLQRKVRKVKQTFFSSRHHASLCFFLLLKSHFKHLFSFSDLNWPLERALDEWSALLKSHEQPHVRNSKQTCNSIAVMAALFRLMGKVTKRE